MIVKELCPYCETLYLGKILIKHQYLTSYVSFEEREVSPLHFLVHFAKIAKHIF